MTNFKLKVCEIYRAMTHPYYFRGRARIAGALASICLPKGYQPYRLINRKNIVLDCQDYFQRCAYFGIYQPEITELVSTLLNPGDIFFDVGANVGYFSCIAADAVGAVGQVHCFEPDPRAFSLLQRTKESNSETENIFLNPVAVSNESGSLQLNLVEQLGWSNAIQNTHLEVKQAITVQAMSLDDYIEKNAIDKNRIKLIKIDIEGWEPYALFGLKQSLSSGCSPSIICEFNVMGLPRLGFQLNDIMQFMESLGYVGYAIREWSHYPLRNLAQIVTGRKVLITPLKKIKPLEHCDLLFLNPKNAIGNCVFRCIEDATNKI